MYEKEVVRLETQTLADGRVVVTPKAQRVEVEVFQTGETRSFYVLGRLEAVVFPFRDNGGQELWGVVFREPCSPWSAGLRYETLDEAVRFALWTID